MLAYYGTKISPHMTDTPEGYLICHDVAIARTGDMVYRAAELQLEGDPDRVVTVRRYAEDVFDPAAIASFEGKDVTAGHPAESVGPSNYAAYSKGHVQNVRRSGDMLVADLLVKDAGLISDIRNGAVREVSCGYLCSYEREGDHYRQGNIRGNHVAVVPRGRAGREVAIKDTAVSAGKGNDIMSKFSEAVLKAFGMAAHEAETPADVEALLPTAAAALDAEPAGSASAAPAQEAEPVVPAEDAASGYGTLEKKLDRLIGLLEAKDNRPEDPLAALDQMIASLEEPGQPEGAAVIPAHPERENTPLSGEARDAAMAILKSVRPAVAAIEDRDVRTKVADALLNAVQGADTLGAIVQAAQGNVRGAADAAAKPSFEKICEEQKAAYDARNPHKKKEAK